MTAVARAVVRMGVVDQDSLAELARWGCPLEDLPPARSPNAEEAAETLEEALRGAPGGRPRETDFDLLERYLRSDARGTLHVEEGDGAERASADFDVTYTRTRQGEYVFAWRSQGIAELMTNGLTHLVVGRERVFFSEVRELFFGETKAFLVCTGSIAEEHDGDQG